MNEPPRRHDITIRVATEAGGHPDPAAFAVTASQAASARNASILSAHTAEEIICVVSVPAATGPEAAAVALAIVAGALKAGEAGCHPANKHHDSPLPDIVLPLTASSNIPPDITPESRRPGSVKRQVKTKDRGCGR
jgi:hypothetical protein